MVLNTVSKITESVEKLSFTFGDVLTSSFLQPVTVTIREITRAKDNIQYLKNRFFTAYLTVFGYKYYKFDRSIFSIETNLYICTPFNE